MAEQTATTPGFGQLLDAAVKKDWITGMQEQTQDLMTYGAPVEGYKPSYEEVQNITKGYRLSDEQSKLLTGSLSPEELQYRAGKLRDQNDNTKMLSDAGWKGTAAEMAAYVSDPIMLPTMAIKTPYVVGRALSTIGLKTAARGVSGVVERAVGSGIIGAGTGVVQEAALSAYDTERDAGDVMLAALTGMVGGAAFSSLADGGASLARKFLSRSAEDIPTRGLDADDHFGLVNESDAAVNKVIADELDAAHYGKAFDKLGEVVEDPVARKVLLSEGDAVNKLIGDLEPTAAQRMSRGDRKAVEVELHGKQNQLDRLTKQLDELQASPAKGSGKSLADARRAKVNDASALRATIESLNGEVNRLSTDLEAHNSGVFAEAVADISRMKQGIIPERLKQQYLDLISEQDAAPAFQQMKSHTPVEEKPSVLPEEAERSVKEELSTAVDKPDTSIGAKEVDDAIIFRDVEGDIISRGMQANLDAMEALGRRIPVVKAAGSISMFTRLQAQMKDNRLRGLGALLFNDPHANRTGVQSAVALSDSIRTRIMPRAVQDEILARNAYFRELGISPLNAGETNRSIIKFDREVTLAQSRLTSNAADEADDYITQAAKARSRAYQESLEAMKRYGVRGFEDVETRADYVPIRYGANDVTSALDAYGEDAVKETFMRGYMNGKIPLSQKSAEVVADAMLSRYYRNAADVGTVKGKASVSKKVAAVKDELVASGVPEDEIRVIVNMLEDKGLDEAISARAMRSLHPNLEAASTSGLRLVDLVDASLSGVDKYVKEAAGSAAFAKNGLKSRRQVEDTIEEAFTSHYKELAEATNRYNEAVEAKGKLRPGVDSSRFDAIINDYKRLGDVNKYRKFLDSYKEDYKDAVKVVFGEAIEAQSSLNSALGASGKLVNLMLLGFSGTAQVADLGLTMARSGIGAVLRNMPTSLYHGVRSLIPSRGEYFMRNRELTDIAEVMGSFSHQDYLFGHKMMNGAEYGDAVIGQVSKLEKGLDTIGWVQSSLSLLRPMQGIIDEVSARSLLNNVVNLSRDGAFTGKTRKAFLDIGKMPEASLDASLAHIRSQMDSGKNIVDAVRTLDPVLRDELGTAIRTIHNGNIGRAYFGELPAFTNKTVGKMMSRLLTFALTAYEKSLQRGVRNDRAALIAGLGFSTGLAMMWAEADIRIQSLKQPDGKRDDFIEKKLGDEYGWTILSRLSQFALVNTGIQMANTISPYRGDDNPLEAAGKYNGLASFGAISKLGKGASAGARLAADESVDEEADLYKLYGIIPLVNTVVGMSVLNTL